MERSEFLFNQHDQIVPIEINHRCGIGARYCINLLSLFFLLASLDVLAAPCPPGTVPTRAGCRKPVPPVNPPSAQKPPQLPAFCPGAPPTAAGAGGDDLTISEMEQNLNRWKSEIAPPTYGKCSVHGQTATLLNELSHYPDNEIGVFLMDKISAHGTWKKVKLNGYAAQYGQGATACMVAYEVLIRSMEALIEAKKQECAVVQNLINQCANQASCPANADANIKAYRKARDDSISTLQEGSQAVRNLIQGLTGGQALYDLVGKQLNSANAKVATLPAATKATVQAHGGPAAPSKISVDPFENSKGVRVSGDITIGKIPSAITSVKKSEDQYKEFLAQAQVISKRIESDKTHALARKTLEDRFGVGAVPPPGGLGNPGGPPLPSASRTPPGGQPPDPRKQGDGMNPLSALAQGLGAAAPLLGSLMKGGGDAQKQNPGAVTAGAPAGSQLAEAPTGKTGASGPPPLQGLEKGVGPPEKNATATNPSGDNPYSSIKERGGGGDNLSGQGPSSATVSSAPASTGGGGGGGSGGSSGAPKDHAPASDPLSPFSGDLLGGGAGGAGGGGFGGSGGGSFANTGANDSIKSILKDMEANMGAPPAGLDQPGNPLALGAPGTLGAADPNDPLAGGTSTWDAKELKMQGANVSLMSADVSLFARHTRCIRQSQLKGKLINGVPKEI